MNTTFIPIIMFVGLLAALLVGIPIAFASGIVALISAYLLWGSSSIFGLLTAAVGTMNNWTLLAIPLFTFMAMVLWKTGVVEDLYDTFYKWTGFLRGGLAVTSVVVGAIMGAMTGVVAGTVIALGTIALPQMLKYKYDRYIAMGSILSGGTLGQLIPPSTLMIVYGTMTGVSVGGLFAGGISSGLLLTAIYCIYILVKSYLKKDLCPIPSAEDRASMKEKIESLRGVMLPILLVLSVLGSIFGGYATPTEASAVGCAGALLCAFIKRTLCWKNIKEAGIETLKTTAMVGWITIGALFFGQVFTAIGGNKLVMDIAMIIPFGKWGFVAVYLMIIFFLGMFLDPVPIVIICAPIFAPIAANLGFDPLWFGIISMVCIQTGYLSPPFGYSLFYLKSVVPKDITLGDIYKSALPFLVLQVIGVILVVVFPKLAMWGVYLLMK